MSVSQRQPSRTRFNSMSAVPKEYERVFRALVREMPPKGYGHKHEVFGVMASVHPDYKEAGPADDFFRFLLNESVVLLDKGVRPNKSGRIVDRFFIDADRALEVAQACSERRLSAPPAPSEERLIAVKPPQRAPKLALVTTPLPAAGHDEDDDTAIESDDMATFEDEPEDTDEVVVTSSAPHHLPVRLAYMTPKEHDVWSYLVLHGRSTVMGEERVTIPADTAEHRFDEIVELTGCSEEELKTALALFEDVGLVSCKGRSEEGNLLYRLSVSEHDVHVETIDGRRKLTIPEFAAGIIRQIERSDFVPEHRAEFAESLHAWMASMMPKELGASASDDLVASLTAHDHGGLGIIRWFPEFDRVLVCVSGLESFVMPEEPSVPRGVAIEKAVLPSAVRRPRAAPVAAAPVVMAQPAASDVAVRIYDAGELMGLPEVGLVAIESCLRDQLALVSAEVQRRKRMKRRLELEASLQAEAAATEAATQQAQAERRAAEEAARRAADAEAARVAAQARIEALRRQLAELD